MTTSGAVVESGAKAESGLDGTRFLVGTVAHNEHVQNIASSLHEAGRLQAYYTGGVDHWRPGLAGTLRRFAGACWPGLDPRLGRRRITGVPEHLLRANWKWEACRLVAGNVMHKPLVEDWLWEKGELALDRDCARAMSDPQFDAFLGVEHGALLALRAAKAAGKLSVVAFLSPHHATREKWEDAEFERFSELLTEARRVLQEKARARDARRDEEAAIADLVHCASEFTKRSLVAAGVPAEKIVSVPLGCPDAVAEDALKGTDGCRFLYSGPVSVRKGAHVLLAAWKKAGVGAGAELHFYGRRTMPDHALAGFGSSVVFHGNVPMGELSEAYQRASMLVFPTLCDGFGLVVGEAFAHGLPVITTPNAGAADLIVEGRNGFLVPAGDSDALAERMEWCMSHPREIEWMRREALETARRWDWAAFRKEFRTELLGKAAAFSGKAAAFSGKAAAPRN